MKAFLFIFFYLQRFINLIVLGPFLFYRKRKFLFLQKVAAIQINLIQELNLKAFTVVYLNKLPFYFISIFNVNFQSHLFE